MEKVRRNKSSKNNLYLGFKYRLQPRSIEPRPLVFKYSYNNANTRYKDTPTRIPMIAWDKNKQQIKDDYQKKYKEYVTLINQYKSQFHSLKPGYLSANFDLNLEDTIELKSVNKIIKDTASNKI